jgi:pyruvate formate lyase activating enzyme
MISGRIHAVQSLGAVDGPGLRSVLFLQGCPLRCVYCHNPDTWDPQEGQEISAEEIVRRLLRYRPYWGESGGVTLSGGEPLLQPEFAREILRLLRAQGIHTALDSSGAGSAAAAESVFAETDLLLLDVKFFTEEDYRSNTGGSLSRTTGMLSLAEQRDLPVWIRHVVVPGMSDNAASMQKLAALAKGYPNVEKIELLPFRKLCLEKYEALKIPFPLASVPEFPEQRLEELYNWLRESGWINRV